ncbi:MAG: hypothetical protein QM765_18170 [Myxococcales bacterium]
MGRFEAAWIGEVAFSCWGELGQRLRLDLGLLVVDEPGAVRSLRSSELDAEDDRPHREQVAGLQLLLGDRVAVDLGPVRASLVLHEEATALVTDDDVLAADPGVIQHHVILRGAPDGHLGLVERVLPSEVLSLLDGERESHELSRT